MSVLERLRTATDSTSTRLLIGAVMFLFVLWIPSSRKSGGKGSGIFATVNGEAITQSEFAQRFRAVEMNMPRGTSKDAQAKAQNDLLDSLVTKEAMRQEAERLGIGVSDDEIVRAIRHMREFAGDDGKFDEKKYQEMLKRSDLTESALAGDLLDQMLVAKLQELVAEGVVVSEAEVKAAWTVQNTKAELSFVRIPNTAFYDDIPVSDADRDDWLLKNGDKAKARYDEQKARLYDLPDRAELGMILLRTDVAGVDKAAVKQRADAVAAEAAAGADFAALASRWSEDLTAAAGGKLGLVPLSQLDAPVADAVKTAGSGHVTGVLETARGFQIYRVETFEPARLVSFDDAKKEIAVQMVREERVGAVVDDFAKKVIASWQASGAPPVDLLGPKQIDVETTGEFAPGGGEIPHLGEVPALATALATARAGTVLPTPFDIKGNKTVVVVTTRTDPDPTAYTTERDTVQMQLLAQKRQAFFEAWQADLVKRQKIEKNIDFVAELKAKETKDAGGS